MGRRPESTLDRASTGNLSIAEVYAASGRHPIGDCPEDFDAVARERWTWAVEKMDRGGYADSSHEASLELMCRTWSEWRMYLDHITEHGPMIEVEMPRDRVIQIPNSSVKAAKDARANLNTLLDALLLTPKAQSRVKAPKLNDDNAEPHWGASE